MPLAAGRRTPTCRSLVVTRLPGLIRRGVTFEHRPSRLFAPGPAARITPAMKRVPALSYLRTARKRRGCRGCDRSDKTPFIGRNLLCPGNLDEGSWALILIRVLRPSRADYGVCRPVPGRRTAVRQ